MLAVLGCGLMWCGNAAGAAAVPSGPERALGLTEYLNLVVQNNESLQAKVLDVEIARRRARGAYGIFEPELAGGVMREYNKRENTAQEYAQSLNQSIFEERNVVYNAGLESLVPTGARVRLGYTLRDLQNNLQVARAVNSGNFTNLPDGEFQSFFGLTLTQPLLRNYGASATLAEIRIMALNSEIAYQEYRRQMMMVVSTAEASYWNLYLAQEQVRAFQESVTLSETVLSDAKARMDAGKGAELDVLEAQSALALRKSKLNEAAQKLNEAANQVAMLYGSAPTQNTNYVAIRAADRPALLTNGISFFEAWRNTFDLNPDYLAQRQRCLLDGVRVAYANNQLLPQVDLKASYGLNGLGETPGESWDDIREADFRSWSVGVEVHIPLGGNIKARNERKAAQLSQRKSLIELKGIENQVANAAHTAVQKIRSREASVPDAEAVVTYVQTLLQTELERLRVGKVEARKALEVEASLLEAKNTLVETLVQYRRAWLEKELVEGSVLKNRGFDLTREDLKFGLKRMFRNGAMTQEEFDNTLRQLQSVHQDLREMQLPDPELPDAADPSGFSRRRGVN
jgi:outer membrane protein TolC